MKLFVSGSDDKEGMSHYGSAYPLAKIREGKAKHKDLKGTSKMMIRSVPLYASHLKPRSLFQKPSEV